MIARSSFSCMGQFSSAPLKERDLYATGHAVSYIGPNDSITPEPVSLAPVVTKILCSGISDGCIVVRHAGDVTSAFISSNASW